MRFVEIYPFPSSVPPTPPDGDQDQWCVYSQEVLWQESIAMIEWRRWAKCWSDHSYSPKDRDMPTTHRPHGTLHFSKPGESQRKRHVSWPATAGWEPHRPTGVFGAMDSSVGKRTMAKEDWETFKVWTELRRKTDPSIQSLVIYLNFMMK